MFSFDVAAMCMQIFLNLISYPIAMTSLNRLRNKMINIIVDLILLKMNDKRSILKFFHEQNLSAAKIFHRLKNDVFGRLLIRRTMKRLKEIGSVAD